MKIFEKEDVVGEIRIVLHFFVLTKNCPLVVGIFKKQIGKASRNLVCNFIQGKVLSTSRRTFNFEFISIIVMETLQALNNQIIKGHPDRPSPIAVSTKQ